jgi:uncharacterized protein YjbI with pentapeptide repeats
MSLEPEVAATPSPDAAATSPHDNDARYPGFPELRAAHLELRDSCSTGRPADASTLATRIREFLTKAQRTGAVLMDPNIRRAAQSVLDYWSAELAGLPGAKTEDFVPFMLAQPEISTLSAVEQPTAENAQLQQNKEEQRALIRFSGMARQWRNANKQPDYLLTGEALQQARPLANQDSDLKELVDASDAAEKARIRKRKRMILYGSLAAVCIVGTVAGLLIWQNYALPDESKSWIRNIQETTSSEIQTTNLGRLAFVQPWTPPYDLSGTRKLTNISFQGLRLYAPNFSSVKFSRIKVAKAQLPAASFNKSAMGIDSKSDDPGESPFKWNDVGTWFRWVPYWHNVRWNHPGSWLHREPVWNNVKWNDFTSAELRSSQFREAQIVATSFSGADLYRAVFDRAVLCDVNFTHADLLSASFWGSTLDTRTYGWLRKTAWWVATGWSSTDLAQLNDRRGKNPSDSQSQSVFPPTTAEDRRALRHALKTSPRFRTEVEIPAGETKLGTFGRAVALNDMAWALANWGIDGDNLEKPSPCDQPTAKPTEALDAASQAICIIEALKKAGSQEKGSQEMDYDYWLANFHDTQAYILMQANRMPEAQALYEEDLTRTEADGGRLFRYAVALNANGKQSDAKPKFETAISDKQYLPTTELQNLSKHIPRYVEDIAYAASDRAYPDPKPTPECPAANAN